MTEPPYFTAFKNFHVSRTPSGVLTLGFHTDGGPATFTGQMHTDLPRALAEIGDDRDNRVLAEGLAAKPQLLTRYLAITVRQRLSRRMAEATQLSMALEGLTAADLAYQQR